MVVVALRMCLQYGRSFSLWRSSCPITTDVTTLICSGLSSVYPKKRAAAVYSSLTYLSVGHFPPSALCIRTPLYMRLFYALLTYTPMRANPNSEIRLGRDHSCSAHKSTTPAAPDPLPNTRGWGQATPDQHMPWLSHLFPEFYMKQYHYVGHTFSKSDFLLTHL